MQLSPNTHIILSSFPLPAELAQNPLLSVESQVFPDFRQITLEHFAPAIDHVLARAKHLVDQISSSVEVTLENTLIPLEGIFNEINKVTNVFYHLHGCNTSDELDALADQYAPILTEFYSSVYQNSQLFARIETLLSLSHKEKLDSATERLLQELRKDFIQSGASLNAADKQTLQKLDKKLSQLTTQMTKLCLASMNKAGVHITDPADLAGLSDDDIAGAQQLATDKGLEGYWLSVVYPSQLTLLSSLEKAEIRSALLTASLERGSTGDENDTTTLIKEIALLRLERAKLLGYRSHAESVIDRNTAPSTQAVEKQLQELCTLAAASAKRERARIEEFAGKTITAADWIFYAEKLRERDYHVDYGKLNAYFPLTQVVENGVFYAAQQLYGLSFKPNDSYPRYRDDIAIWDVYDENDQHRAIFLADFFARSSKRGGAWMNNLRDQSFLFNELPVVCNTLNIPPSQGTEAYISLDNVITLFHEFGHALHGMLSQVHYPSQSGTNVPRDYVEFPSQVNEMWALWPEIMERYTAHKVTGESMPEEIRAAIEKSNTFGEGFATYEYLAACIIDWAYHRITDPAELDLPWEEFEHKALIAAGLDIDIIPSRYRGPYFQHIFAGGYSAGYYGYIWSEVLDANICDWFKQQGGLQRHNGKKLADTILSQGGSVDSLAAFRQVFGQDPTIDALLKRRGLIEVS